MLQHERALTGGGRASGAQSGRGGGGGGGGGEEEGEGERRGIRRKTRGGEEEGDAEEENEEDGEEEARLERLEPSPAGDDGSESSISRVAPGSSAAIPGLSLVRLSISRATNAQPSLRTRRGSTPKRAIERSSTRPPLAIVHSRCVRVRRDAVASAYPA